VDWDQNCSIGLKITHWAALPIRDGIDDQLLVWEKENFLGVLNDTLEW